MKTNRMAKVAWLGFSAALLGLSGSARRLAAQTPPQEQAAPAAPAQPQTSPVVIRKESRLVLVDAVVTDKKGNYVRDLTDKDFKIYEDNKEQPVASFSSGARGRGKVCAGQQRPGPHDGGRGFRRQTADRPEFYGQCRCADRGRQRRETFERGFEPFRCGEFTRAGNRSFDGTFFAKQRRSGFWRAHHAAGGAQPGEKSAHGPRAKNAGAFFRRLRVDAGERIGADGHNRCVQQGQRRDLLAGCAWPESGAADRRRWRQRAERSRQPRIQCRATRGIQG